MDDLEQLIARDEIRRLADRYALAVDAKDLDGVAALFHPDVDNGRYGPGREGVRTFYDHILRAFDCSMHLVANHVIDFDDDSHARGVVYCRAHHHVLEPDHWYDEAVACWDTYEKLDGEWLFTGRRVKSWYHQEFGHPEHGTDRIPPWDRPAMRGVQMPEAFPTYATYWAREPRPLPARRA